MKENILVILTSLFAVTLLGQIIFWICQIAIYKDLYIAENILIFLAVWITLIYINLRKPI